MSAASSSERHVVFHYPPEVMQNLKNVIPLLCRSKKDVLTFFSGVGVPESLMADLRKQIQTNPDGIKKYEIVRTVLERLNAKKDNRLQELREIVRRVTEFEDFSSCWEADQLKAKGLVAELREIVEVKDAFTRMRIERENEAKKAKEFADRKAHEAQQRREKTQTVTKELFALFSEPDAQRRGKALEGVLNRLFEAYGIAVREAFTVKGPCGQGVIEQIDGVIEIEGDLCLVEMKWWNTPIGRNEISPHLVRLFSRGSQVKGIFISYTKYTEPAIQTCREALAAGAVIALCTLQEIVHILDRYEQGADLRSMLRTKIHAALIDKKPWQDCT